MGSVNFDTNVLKNVNIAKTVNLTVDKTVLSAVQLTGNLATAEASADAIGGDPVQGGGTSEKVRLVIDDFQDRDVITANVLDGTDPAESPGPVALTTDLVGTARTLYVDVLNPSGGQADFGVNNPNLEVLTFDQGINAWSNAYAEYEGAGFDPFEGADNADIVQDFLDNFDPTAADPLAEVCYTYRFEGIEWEPGKDADQTVATLRVTLVVGDSVAGDYAATTALLVANDAGEGFEDLSIEGAVAGLIDPAIAALVPPGTVLAEAPNGAKIVQLGVNTDIDGDGSPIDFDNVDYFQLMLEDNPAVPVGVNSDGVGPDMGGTSFTSLNVAGPVGSWTDPVTGEVYTEVLSVDGTDLLMGDFTYTTCIPSGDYGLVAEVDTFAQVEEGGAFAFSESLAALDLLI